MIYSALSSIYSGNSVTCVILSLFRGGGRGGGGGRGRGGGRVRGGVRGRGGVRVVCVTLCNTM